LAAVKENSLAFYFHNVKGIEINIRYINCIGIPLTLKQVKYLLGTCFPVISFVKNQNSHVYYFIYKSSIYLRYGVHPLPLSRKDCKLCERGE